MSDHKNELESWVVGQIQDGIDPKARRTRGSGCGNEIGDVSNDVLFVECKMKHTHENIIVEFKNEWQHLLFRLPMKTIKYPIMFVENKFGNKFAVLDAEDFFHMLRRLKGYEQRQS
jgi:hypothetical protein